MPSAMVFLNPKTADTSKSTPLIVRTHFIVRDCTPSLSCTHFVVKIVQIQRSPIFEAMGHTSVFPIDENEVAEVVVLFSR